MKIKQEEVNKRYKNKYVEFIETYDYSTREYRYEIIKVYKTIQENTTLGQDVGTDLEYTR